MKTQNKHIFNAVCILGLVGVVALLYFSLLWCNYSSFTQPTRVYNDAGPMSEEELIEIEHPYSFVATGPFTALPPRDAWMPKFRKSKAYKLHTHPLCEGCGRQPDLKKKVYLAGHHNISVSDIQTALNPDGTRRYADELQWDADNISILCQGDPFATDPIQRMGCHLRLGHTVNGHSAWTHSNHNVRRDIAISWKKLHPNRTYEQAVEEYNKTMPAGEIVKPRKQPPAKTEQAI